MNEEEEKPIEECIEIANTMFGNLWNMDYDKLSMLWETLNDKMARLLAEDYVEVRELKRRIKDAERVATRFRGVDHVFQERTKHIQKEADAFMDALASL